MWDIVTPIMAGSQHIGFLFVGQFFFDDEPLDFEIFRSQARKCGFNEEGYLTALDKVPRLSRDAVNTGVSFFMTFANMLSQLSYSNSKLAKSLAKGEFLLEVLQESEKRGQDSLDELAIVSDAVPAFMLITHDPQALKMTGNRVSHEWLKLPENANLSKSAPDGERPENYKLFKDELEIPVEDLPMRLAASGKEVRDYEMDIVYNDGTMRHLLGDAIPLRDEKGNSRGAVAAFLDITKRKEAEEKLRQSEEKYRNIVETANEGISTIDGRGLVTYANKKLLDMLGYCAEEFINKSSYVFVEDVAPFEEKLEERHKGISDSSELKLICKDGSKLWVHASVKSLFDDKGDYVGSLGMFTDITKKKNAEKKLKETLDNLEYIVEERTSELKEAYELLKEREEGLSEAQEMAHIGNWNWNLLTEALPFSA